MVKKETKTLRRSELAADTLKRQLKKSKEKTIDRLYSLKKSKKIIIKSFRYKKLYTLQSVRNSGFCFL